MKGPLHNNSNPNQSAGNLATMEADGFRLLFQTGRMDYPALLRDFRSGAVTGRCIGGGHKDRQVFLLERDGLKFVLKRDAEIDRRFEKRLWQRLSGPYYSKLLRRVMAARQAGCRATPEILLVAEKMRRGCCVESYVLTEYVEGQTLKEVKDRSHLTTEIRGCIESLHRHGLASGDIKLQNFIVSPDGIRLIDLSDRGPRWICRAKDVLALEKKLGIGLLSQDIFCRLLKARNSLRRLLHGLSGRGAVFHARKGVGIALVWLSRSEGLGVWVWG